MQFPRFDTPYFVLADRTRLKQVLINLLFNAVKYNRPGGTVVVDCLAVAPNSLRVSVRDTGEGLPAEKLAQLFQPFNRLGKEAGAKDFVSKPFDLTEVKTRIHNMLEVRLLYRRLDNYNKVLEQTVQERTAALRESEARFRALTELASDWYWESDEHQRVTKVSGPILDMLGIQVGASMDEASVLHGSGWNEAERAELEANIKARRPFLDFPFSRTNPDGSHQYFRASGEPIFDRSARFIGYRGIGVEVTGRLFSTVPAGAA